MSNDRRHRFGLVVVSLFLLLLLSDFSGFGSTCSHASVASPLDATTLRSLGVPESELENLLLDAEDLEDYSSGGSGSRGSSSSSMFPEQATSTSRTSSRTSSSSGRSNNDDVGVGGDEDYRSGEYWWRDPLAQFEQDEEDGSGKREQLFRNDVTMSEVEQDIDDFSEEPLEVLDESEIGNIIRKTSDKEPSSSSLPADAKRRLAEKHIVPREEVSSRSSGGGRRDTAPARGSSSSSSSSATSSTQQGTKTVGAYFSAPAMPALLLPVLPKVRKMLLASPPTATIVGSFMVGQFVLRPIWRKYKREEEIHNIRGDDAEEEEEEGDEQDEQVMTELDDMEDSREPSSLERMSGFTPSARSRLWGYGDEDLQEQEDEEEEDEEVEGESAREEQPSSPLNNALDSFLARRRRFQVFGGANRVEKEKKKRPSVKQLEEENEELRQRAESAEADRDMMEKEYEQSSWQLKETQNQLDNLMDTSKYLKNQLKDNEATLERVRRVERQKATDQLERIKGAMENELKRERKLMREQMQCQSDQLRAMMKKMVDEESEASSSSIHDDVGVEEEQEDQEQDQEKDQEQDQDKIEEDCEDSDGDGGP